MTALEELYKTKQTLILLRLLAEDDRKIHYTKVLEDLQKTIYQITLEDEGLTDL